MKNIQIIAALMLLCFSFAGCYKDKGNYSYNPINELSISAIDTVQGYNVDFGNTLSIDPAVTGTLDPDGSKGSYSYEWCFSFSTADSVIATTKSLNAEMTVAPGTYTLIFKVKDTKTGVQFRARTKVLVSTKIFEGYLVMNEVNGLTRLDMLSYYRTNETFVQHTDVLSEMGSSLKPQGKPRQVFCMDIMYLPVATPKSYRIYLVTDKETNKIDPETFEYNELNNIRYEVTGTIPDNFNASYLGGGLRAGILPVTLMASGNNVFQRVYAEQIFAYVPMNIYAGQPEPFKAFPTPVMNNTYISVYNMDKRTFTSGALNAVVVTDVAPSLNYPTGKDMVYMEYNISGKAHAILKDPGTSNFYLFRFTPGSSRDYFESLVAPDIDKATCFAVSPDQGYLFYAVGGKLYEYDLFLKTSKLMLDKGNAVISFLSFHRFFNTSAFAKYTDWGKLLNVGSYDPAGTEGSNGKLEQYSVPAVNEQIVLKNSWSGFGKIVSLSYRER